MVTAASLPKRRRLTTAAEFHRVMRAGSRKRNAMFTMVTLPNRGPGSRLGLAVSRRVSRKAVVRNRVKRQVREVFRQYPRPLGNVDIVVVAHPAAAQSANAALRHRLWQLLESLYQQGENARELH